MAAMTTMNAISLHAANLKSVSIVSDVKLGSTASLGGMRLNVGNQRVSIRPARSAVIVRAKDGDSIDRFAEGVKSDAKKNTQNLGEIVSEKADKAAATVKDVGRDMGGKAQEAVDAGKRTLDQAGDKAREVGDEVKDSTQKTANAATDTSTGESYAEKAKNAAGNVGENLKQKFDQGTGATQNAADDLSKDVKKTADRL